MSALATAVLLCAATALVRPEPADVLIVRSETGAPLQGAEVFALDERTFMDLVFPSDDTLEAAIEKHGTRLVADAQGAVQVTGSKVLWGRSGDRRGMLDRSPLPGSFVLEPCAQIAVSVLDGEGNPAAGARVVLRGHVRGEALCAFPAGVTDAAGELAFPHFFPMVDGFPFERWSASLDVLGAPPMDAFYDLAAPPAEPLTLVRPPVGALLLRAVDEQGKRINHRAAVLVSAVGVGGAAPRAKCMEGELRLNEVVLGARIRVDEAEVEGPTWPGEVREHEVAFTPGDELDGSQEVRALDAGTYLVPFKCKYQRRVGSVIWSGPTSSCVELLALFQR